MAYAGPALPGYGIIGDGRWFICYGSTRIGWEISFLFNNLLTLGDMACVVNSERYRTSDTESWESLIRWDDNGVYRPLIYDIKEFGRFYVDTVMIDNLAIIKQLVDQTLEELFGSIDDAKDETEKCVCDKTGLSGGYDNETQDEGYTGHGSVSDWLLIAHGMLENILEGHRNADISRDCITPISRLKFFVGF